MSRTGLPLHKAVYDLLTGDSGLDALIDGRVYDGVPAAPTFPYVTLRESAASDLSADCVVGEEVFLEVHVWSREGGRSVEGRRIGAAIIRLLDEADLVLDDPAALVVLHFQSSRSFADADGLTTHGVLTFAALTEET